MKRTLLVEGMSCNHCVMAVKNALGELEDILNIDIDLKEKKVEVEGNNLLDDKLKEAIEDAGYEVVEIK